MSHTSKHYFKSKTTKELEMRPKASKHTRKVILDQSWRSRANCVAEILIRTRFSKILTKVKFQSKVKG